jgi:TrmH family RNA methyltransferase
MVVCSSEELFHWLQKNKITAYAAALTANDDYHHVDFCKPAAIILGTEATGLSDYWLEHASQIKIPMSGKIDSLNVSNAAAILAFEAKRQRGFK